MNKALVLFTLLFPIMSLGALSPEAKNYLEKIPGQTLTLPYVIRVALENADAYRIIGLERATAQIQSLETGAITDTVFSASYDYLDDNSSKTSPFQPLRAKTTQWKTGVSKTWLSGTKTTVGWEHSINNFEYSAALGAFANSFITSYKQSVGVVQLEQNLLRDSFGSALRDQMQAAKMAGEAIEWTVRDELENTTLEFIGQFYGAWLLQEQVKTAQARVERQARLVRVLTKRASKGAVEKPDLIQVEALLATSKTQLKLAKTELINRWQQLVVGLKLPESFMYVDPMDIPTEIDSPVATAIRLCEQRNPEKTASIKSLEYRARSLQSGLDAAESQYRPDLKLVAGYRGNSIDGSASTTFSEVLNGRDENGFGNGPAWNVGLALTWPLSNSQAKARQIKAYVEKEKTDAQLQIAKDQLSTQWNDRCRRLQAEWDNLKIFNNVVKEQKKRVGAENRRFRLGRLAVNQLVTAEDDLGQWEFQSQQKAIEVRRLAWEIQKITGDLFLLLQPHIEKMTKGQKL